jgi:DNA-binding NarL/FixJ family response regulator
VLEQPSDRVPGEVGLRDEAERVARVDEFRELGSGLRRDEDDRRPAARELGESPRDVEAALGSEVDVDEHGVGVEGERRADGLVGRRGDADDRDAVVTEELLGCDEELGAVVDDEAREPLGGHLPVRVADAAGRRQTESGPVAYLLAGRLDTSNMPRRVAIADDEVLLRQGLAALLREGGYDVVGEASDADGMVELVRKTQPDIAIVDIRMPPTHTTEGLDAARTIREELPQVAILVLSAHIEVEHAMDLLGAGRGIGYLLKSRVGDIDELVDTLDRISGGGSVVDPALVEELVRARRARDPLEGLTSREREVLALMAEGRSNSGIGRLLFLAEGTVEKHVRSIFQKLRLPDAPDDHRRVLAVVTFLGSK